MRFYIPAKGDKIYLEEDWTFTIWNETRNFPLLKALGLAKEKGYRSGEVVSYGAQPKWKVTIPAGVTLVIDRIYIRGSSDYSSVTFRVANWPGDKKKEKKRFWAKLKDANKIECLPVNMPSEED